MRWLKVEAAAQEWAGGLSPKTVYRAIRAGQLKAARVGAGRNVLLCEEFVEEWLRGVSVQARREPKRRGRVRAA